MTSSKTSDTRLIERLKTGDEAATQKLWNRYFERLVRFARKHLRQSPRRAADEEDVALSAFKSVCIGARAGRFPQLSDSDNLWRLLVVITSRKAVDQIKHERRLRRGGGRVVGESGLRDAGSSTDVRGFDAIISQQPTPQFAAEVAEQYTRLLDQLGDQKLRDIAMLKLENFTNEEIAARLGCGLRTVARRLVEIRKTWEGEIS
jgi:RNA polymerase sigma factor (sigma-70 family)